MHCLQWIRTLVCAGTAVRSAVQNISSQGYGTQVQITGLELAIGHSVRGAHVQSQALNASGASASACPTWGCTRTISGDCLGVVCQTVPLLRQTPTGPVRRRRTCRARHSTPQAVS